MPTHPTLSGSFAPATPETLSKSSLALFRRLPADYRMFLARTNGGFASKATLEFSSGVPYKSGDAIIASREDSIVEFFGMRPRYCRASKPRDLLKCKTEFEAGEFLPSGVIAVGSCSQNSLVCLSLRDESFGSVWYWDWYWQYPWCQEFFEGRIQAAREANAQLLPMLNDKGHPGYRKVADAMNFATLVRLADTFTAWLAMLKRRH